MQASLHDVDSSGKQLAEGVLLLTAEPELGFMMRFALFSSSTNQAIGEVSFVLKPGQLFVTGLPSQSDCFEQRRHASTRYQAKHAWRNGGMEYMPVIIKF